MLATGISSFSVSSYAPSIKSVRPTVKDFPGLFENAIYTSADMMSDVYKANVPEYDINALTPNIPNISAKFTYSTPKVEIPQFKINSATALLMNKAAGILAYQKA